MEVRQFQYFASVVDCGSMSRASARAGISQPSLSQQIRNLEDELGLPLLVRSAQGVAPTEFGLKVYAQAQRILRELAQAVEETRSLGEGERFEGSVSIGLPGASAAMLGHRLFLALRDKYPAIRFRLVDGTPEHLLEQLMASRIDLTLQFGVPKLPALRCEPLYEEVIYLVEREADPTTEPISWHDVVDKTIVMTTLPLGIRDTMDRYMEEKGRLQSVIADVDNFLILREIVLNGDAASFLPWSAVCDLDSKQLSIRQIEGAQLKRTVSISSELNSLKPQLTELIGEEIRFILDEAIRQEGWTGIRLLPKS